MSDHMSDGIIVAKSAPRGRVYLVGAGPGDPDLLTVKALRILQNARIVAYDELVGPAMSFREPHEDGQIDAAERGCDERASARRTKRDAA